MSLKREFYTVLGELSRDPAGAAVLGRIMPRLEPVLDGADDPAAVLAYGRAKLAELAGQPAICWSCGAEVPDSPEVETCPVCGVELVPF